MTIDKEFVLFNLDNIDSLYREIMQYLEGRVEGFDIQIILSESLSNAFIHGNRKDASQPIYLRVSIGKEAVNFEVEDSGLGPADFSIPDEIPEENILNDHGRGLFLLNCFSDSLDFQDHTLKITKKFCSHAK